MKKVILVIILLLIIAFTTAGYYFIAHFSKPHAPIRQNPSAMISQTQTQFCQQNQLSANITTQGAAGNIFATLILINTTKTSCEVTLGNTIMGVFNAKNIVTNYKQNAPAQNFILAPSGKVYSQIHYPNGPQCQSSIVEQKINFVYKTAQTSITFQSTGPGEKLLVQACSAPSQKTVIDIWPLSKNPIVQ